MRKHILYIILAGLCLASCSDWTKTQSIDLNFVHPWEQNPELWTRYKAALRDYKARDHYLFYARFENSPENAGREDGFMRSLPDSLDFVSLTNADNFSSFDAQDMEWMKSIGTKVLYRVDLDKKAFTSTTELNTYLDSVVTVVTGNGLDGYAFAATWKLGNSLNDNLASALVEKLSGVKTTGQYLVFEGNPKFVPEADRDKVDYFVLDTEDTDNTFDLRMQVVSATDYAGVPATKLMLGSTMGGEIQDEDKNDCDDVEEISRRVVSLGPLAGLGISGIADDYYSASGNYVRTRAAIQLLNPSK